MNKITFLKFAILITDKQQVKNGVQEMLQRFLL